MLKVVNRMKKVLILGLGSAQLDAALYCKNHGMEVHSCALDDSASKNKVDYFSLIDIADVDRIFEYTKKEQIDLVYSVGSDMAIPTAAYVSQKLNLPYFLGYEHALICRDKAAVRRALGNDFAGNIPFMAVESKQEAIHWNIFPCMLKPVDSQGQKGIFLISHKKDIDQAIDKALEDSKSGKVIIEEYIDGPEISANVYMVNGKVAFLQTTDRIVFEQYPGIVKAHSIPSRVTDKNIEAKVFDLVQYTTNILKINNGPAYFQMKLKGKEPKLIEVTPRLDGCHLWHLIKEYCGVDLIEAAFGHLLDQKIDLSRKSAARNLTLEFITDKPGVVVNKANYCIEKNYDVCWGYEDEEIVRRVNGFEERIGYYIAPS